MSQKLVDNGFFAFTNLARLNGYKLDSTYDVLADALHDGVPPQLVPLANIKDIGRKRTQAIVKVCDALVVNLSLSPAYTDRRDGTAMNYKGKELAKKDDRISGKSCLEFLARFCSRYGEQEVKTLLRSAQGIGPVPADKVLELLRTRLGSATSASSLI